MKTKNEASGISIVVGIFCVIMSALGAMSLARILPRLGGWQAAAYAIAGGIFIALAAAILNHILSFFYGDRA